MLKLEGAVSSDQVEKVTEAIIRVDVDNAAHIRTGETDEIAGRTAG
jgi:nitrogen regulatory protein PII